MTLEIDNLIKQKNRMLKKYLDRPITYNDQYKTLRNRVNHMISTRKRQFYENEFSESSGDMKRTWKTIFSIMNKHKSKGDIKELLVDQNHITDPKEICENFNKHFASVGTFSDNATPSRTHFSHYLRGNYPDFQLSEVTEAQVKSTIAKMKVSGPGEDEINMKLLKEGSDVIVLVLSK